MCGFNSIYHDVNVCYYGRTMVNFNKIQIVSFENMPYEKGGCCNFYRCY